MCRDTCHTIRIAIQFATFLHFLFECHTNITACSSSQRQSAKQYQLMSHVMSSAINGVMTSHCAGDKNAGWRFIVHFIVLLSDCPFVVNLYLRHAFPLFRLLMLTPMLISGVLEPQHGLSQVAGCWWSRWSSQAAKHLRSPHEESQLFRQCPFEHEVRNTSPLNFLLKDVRFQQQLSRLACCAKFSL